MTEWYYGGTERITATETAMLITRRSMFTGKTHEREIDCTEEQVHAWRNGQLAQDAFPQLSASDREFIMTGVTPEEWAAEFPPGEEEGDL